MFSDARMPSSALDALAFLKKPPKSVGPLVAVFGVEAYLKREVLREIRRVLSAAAAGADEMDTRSIEGPDADLRDVIDELCTVSLFGDCPRLVIVEDAETFVTEHRAALEKYLERPAKRGVLVLDVKTWRSDTRLARSTDAAGGLAIRCDPPKLAQIRDWLTRRAKELAVEFQRDALSLLLDLAPLELGILEQELAKLATAAGKGGKITPALVQENVGGGRVRETWDMIEAAARGDAPQALVQLDRLIAAGEEPQGILPQMAGVLRRFVIAGRLIEAAERAGRRPNFRAALQEAGVKHFKLDEAEGQLRQMGRQRVAALLGQLLDTDLALKGSHSQRDAARRVVERLIVQLSKAADPRRPSTV
jgi:DNA polymerase-3 subunit delta